MCARWRQRAPRMRAGMRERPCSGHAARERRSPPSRVCALNTRWLKEPTRRSGKIPVGMPVLRTGPMMGLSEGWQRDQAAEYKPEEDHGRDGHCLPASAMQMAEAVNA